MSTEPPVSPQIQHTLRDRREPAWKRYARLTVGTPCVGRLLLHELLTGLLGGLPGAAGLALRSVGYRLLLGSIGRGTTIGRGVTLRGAARIRLGHGVAVDDFAVLDARGPEAAIEIGDGTLISRNTILRARNGRIEIGPGCDVGANCILGTDSHLRLGREVLVAAFCYLTAGGHHAYEDPDTPIIRQGLVSKGGIEVGDDVWLGSHTAVLDGVRIGAGAVVGAHSLVNKSLPERAVAWGQPARQRRTRGEEPPAPAATPSAAATEAAGDGRPDSPDPGSAA